jgi:membrane-bound lytic murein transglycosylase D
VIREVNQIPSKMVLKAGSTILVPKSSLSADTDIAPEVVDNATIAVERDLPETKRITVKVGKRDNLASIARHYKVSVAQLKDWNSLHRDSVAPGQKLQIQVPYQLATGAKSKGHRLAAASKAKGHRLADARKSRRGKTVMARSKSRGKSV